MKANIDKFLYFCKNIFFKLKDFIDNNFLISILLVFGFFLVSFLFIYMSLPTISFGDDHYFHFRFAERLFENGFFDSFRNFKSLYFTNITNGGHLLYYNFLFYLVLMPFTFIAPLYIAIKLYAILSISFIGITLYYFIKKIEIRNSFLWSLGFFVAIGVGSFWRLFLSRPFVLSPLIILLLILAISKKKNIWIFIFSFLPLFWHTATFFIPILVMIVYFFIYLFYYKKYLWEELFYVLLGTSTAVSIVLFIDSGFFISIRDNLFGVLSSVLNISGNEVNISEGTEVYPRNFFDLFNQNIFLCSMFISAIVFYALNFFKEIKEISSYNNSIKNRKIIITVFFILSSVFIISIPNISYRFTDFFIFFGWVFVVLVFDEAFSYVKFNNFKIKKFFNYAIFICLMYLFLNSSLQLHDIFSDGNNPEAFLDIGNYISQNIEKNEIIFNVNWSWFPQLYYYAPEQNYVIGLEPKLTYIYNPRIYWLWFNMSQGYICGVEDCSEISQKDRKEIRGKDNFLPWMKEKGENIADVILGDFKSHYIVTSTEYSKLNDVLNNSKRFEQVFNSKEQYFIYRILPK